MRKPLRPRRRSTPRGTPAAFLEAWQAFLAASVHDLKNPLAAIRGYAQLARAQTAGRADLAFLARYLAAIDSAARRSQILVDQMLDVVRLEAGQGVALEPGPTDLTTLARRLVALVQVEQEDHELVLEGAEQPLVGTWDARRLERALDNLLSNAVKYSPVGSRVTLRLQRDEDEWGAWAVITVQDAGIGIPREEQERVFERFVRGSNVGQVRGTGLGLATVRYVVEQHGGTVRVESQVGQGSRFTIRLPLTMSGRGG